MSPETIASISGVTLVAVQLVKWGLPQITGGRALALVGSISLLLCALWQLGTETPFAPSQAYVFASGWITVMSSAAGVYGFITRPLRTE